MKQILLIFHLIISCLANTQQVSNTPPLEGKGEAGSGASILLKTIEQSGGSLWQQPKTLQLSGNATFTPFGKTDSSSFYFDTYKMYRVFPTENIAARKANGKVRFDANYGDSNFMQLKFGGKTSTNYLSTRAKPYEKYFSWSNNFGFSIIRFALRDSFKIELLVDDNIEGFLCSTIQITDPKKFVTKFWIDKKSYFIRSVAFLTDIGYHHRIYSNFEKIKPKNGEGFFIQPQKLKIYFDGVKWMDINWLDNKVNEEVGDEIFE